MGRWAKRMLLACALASGCGDDSSGSTQREGRSEVTVKGGDRDPCADRVTRSIAWDETTAVGVTPRAAFASLAGECRSPLSWDGSPSDDRTIVPNAGTSEATIRVTLDETTARVHESTHPSCRPTLEVEADVSIATSDGTFRDQGRAAVGFSMTRGVAPFGFTRTLEELGGSLTVSKRPSERVALAYSFNGAGPECAGSISLSASEVHADGSGSGSDGHFGSWSVTGCPVDSPPAALVRLEEPSAGGLSILETLARRLEKLSLDGRWDDGTQTALELAVTTSARSACRDQQDAVLIPVQATYGTSDGRIRSHTSEATVRVSLRDGAVEHIQLNISEALACESADAALAYTSGDCRVLASATVQLLINLNERAGVGSEGRLDIYEYRRDSAATASAADSVKQLALTVP